MNIDARTFFSFLMDYGEPVQEDSHHITIEYSINHVKPVKAKPAKDATCGICLSDDNKKTFVANDCDHIFHEECLTTWLSGHDTCPTCRKSISTKETKEIVAGVGEISNKKFNKIKGYNNVRTIWMENENDPMLEESDRICDGCECLLVDSYNVMKDGKDLCATCVKDKESNVRIKKTFFTALNINQPLPKKLFSIDFGKNITVSVPITDNVKVIVAQKCLFTETIKPMIDGNIQFDKCVFKSDVIIHKPLRLRFDNCKFANPDNVKAVFQALNPNMTHLSIECSNPTPIINLFENYTLAQKTAFNTMLENIECFSLVVAKPLFINVKPEFKVAKRVEIANIIFNDFPITNKNIEYLCVKRVTLKPIDTLIFTEYNHLQHLHIEHCKINNIQFSTTSSAMTGININNCGLKTISNFPSELNQITLAKNKLTTIPKMSHLSKCNAFLAQNNQLTVLEGLPKSLKILDVSNNRLTKIDLKGLTALSIIQVQNNYLQDFSYDAGIDVIEELFAYNNKFENFLVTSSRGNLKRIETLNISNNPMGEIYIDDFVKLGFVHLAHNKYLERIYANLIDVHHLNVRGCKNLKIINLPMSGCIHYLNLQNSGVVYVNARSTINVLKLKINRRKDATPIIKNKILEIQCGKIKSAIIVGPHIITNLLNKDVPPSKFCNGDRVYTMGDIVEDEENTESSEESSDGDEDEWETETESNCDCCDLHPQQYVRNKFDEMLVSEATLPTGEDYGKEEGGEDNDE
jgi:hypothetical protein